MARLLLTGALFGLEDEGRGVPVRLLAALVAHITQLVRRCRTMPTITAPGLPDPLGTWNRIICVDWGIEHAKRAAWIADAERATVSPLDVEPSVRALIARAGQMPGRTLIGIDAALGIPKSYLAAAKAGLPSWGQVESFPDWLLHAAAGKGFKDAVTQASEWCHERPFIALRPTGGVGSLTAFWDQAGGELRREVDVATGGKSPFVVSGIPGSVGSGSRALWLELFELLTPHRGFALWPFDGADRLGRERVVVGEIYPRACYAMALSSVLPVAARPVAKTRSDVREAVVDELLAAPWLATRGVKIDARGLARARANEDDFDAMVSAAALLRAALEGRSLDDPGADPVEGGILGLASIVRPAPRPAGKSRRPRGATPARAAVDSPTVRSEPSAATGRTCPIDGCGYVFKVGRNGWDRHVETHGRHPTWHASVVGHQERKALFREQFAAWFL